MIVERIFYWCCSVNCVTLQGDLLSAMDCGNLKLNVAY